MIIKINIDGKMVGKVEIVRDEIYDDDWRIINKNGGVENIYIDMEQGEMGFTECIDIDLKREE